MISIEVDPAYRDFKDFAVDIKRYFAASGELIAKKRNVIKVMDHRDKRVVVKSFKVPNLINKFAYRFIRDSKAKRSFLNAQKLQELGINTPAPIAYVEFFSPLLGESFYICEHFDYDFEIRDLLNDASFEDRETILKAFVTFSFHLHEKGVYHIDYSPGNVLVKRREGGYDFSIVDVNRMKFLTFDDALRFKNLSRFSASHEDTEAIAKAYAKLSGIEERFAVEKLFFYHDKHQAYLENKRRLKSLKS